MAVQNRFGVEMDTDRMVAQFMEMVQVDSESGDEARFLDWLRPRLEDLGGSAQLDAYGNLIAKLPARQSVAAPILLSCHGDTVKPGKGIRPVLADGVIRSAGDTILGADDKAGIAEMIETLRVAPVRPPIEIAISRQEEVGLLGVKQLDFSLISARRGFLLDNDTLDTIITGGPSYFAIDVTVTGKSAHAGMEPEKGINAIQAASRAIAALTLGRLDHETTANVGIIQGGMIRNGVPASCTFAAECRSLTHDKGQNVADTMVATIRREVEAFGAAVSIQVNNSLPGLVHCRRCVDGADGAAGAGDAGDRGEAGRDVRVHRRVDLQQPRDRDGCRRNRRAPGAFHRGAHLRRGHGACGGDDGRNPATERVAAKAVGAQRAPPLRRAVIDCCACIVCAPVAQLDRASASGAEGHRFESCRARHTFRIISNTVD